MAVFVKKYLDVTRFTLWAEGVGENKRARLVLGFRDGHPRLIINTGVQGKDGLINFPADVPTITYFLMRLKEVAAGEPNTRWPIESLGTVYENDKPTKGKRLVSTLHVGKSSTGIVYISVIMENRPKIVFEIRPSEYHVFKDKDNQKLPDEVISCIMAKGLSDFMLGLLADGIMRHAVEEATDGYGGSAPMQAQPVNAPLPAGGVSILDDIPY